MDDGKVSQTVGRRALARDRTEHELLEVEAHAAVATVEVRADLQLVITIARRARRPPQGRGLVPGQDG